MSKRTGSRNTAQAKARRRRHARRVRWHGELIADIYLACLPPPVAPYWPGPPNIHAERRWAKRTRGRPLRGKGRRRLRGRRLRLYPAGIDGAAFFDTDRHPLDKGGTFSNLLAPAPRWDDIKAGIEKAAERFRLAAQERDLDRLWPRRWSRDFLYDMKIERLCSWPPPPIYLDADPEPSRPRRYKASALRTWLRAERKREWDEARAVDRASWIWHATEPDHDPLTCGRCVAERRRHQRVEEGLVPLGPLDTYNGVKVSALCIECRNKIAWVEHRLEASVALCTPCSDLVAKAAIEW